MKWLGHSARATHYHHNYYDFMSLKILEISPSPEDLFSRRRNRLNFYSSMTPVL